MSIKNTSTTYGSVSKFFHWLIFILVLCMVTFGFFLGDVPKDYQPITYNIHKLTGLTILSLMVLRLLGALINLKPVLPKDTLPWQRVLERYIHFFFYLGVIPMPFAGWIGSIAGGRPPHLGSFAFNLPVEQNKALAEAAFNMHNLIAFFIIALVSIHIVAALYHHFIKKDDVLRRMMPHRSHV